MSIKTNLKPNAQPFAISTPKNIPFSLRPKVQEELVCAENLGAISCIREPTLWCAAMMVVPKTSGAVRIREPLNENVLRENQKID